MTSTLNTSRLNVEARIAKRVLAVPSSKVREIFDLANRLEREGKNIIHLEIGRPWFDTPAPIKDAAKEALDRGMVHYSPNRGIRELREAIAVKLKRENGIEADPETQVMITSGNKQATYLTILALTNEGDEVIVTDPHYSPHSKEIVFAGGVPRYLELAPGDGWQLHREALEALVSERTKLIFFNTPHNPTGRVFSQEELQIVADVAIKHDLLVLTDETYEYIVFDGHKHHSLGGFEGMKDRTISTFAFTKSFAMDGWRLGYLAGPVPLVNAMVKLVQLDTASPNTFAQYGALEAVTCGKSHIEPMVEYDQKARDLTVQRFNTMGLPCPEVQGTIHAFPDLSAIDVSEDRAANILLEEAGVAATPGSAYGKCGKGRVRFSFGAVPHEKLNEALDRIEKLGQAS